MIKTKQMLPTINLNILYFSVLRWLKFRGDQHSLHHEALEWYMNGYESSFTMNLYRSL